MIFFLARKNMDDKGKGLVAILNEHFDWNTARLKCFAGILLALLKVRTVNGEWVRKRRESVLAV